MSAMIIAMAKTIAITRGSNKTNGRMSWKGTQGIKRRDSVFFLEEGCRKDDFIIEYTGKVTKTNGGKYSMKIKPPEFKGKRKRGGRKVYTVYIDANIDGGLAKYINHSCDPNCKLIQWYVEGLPRMCFFAKRDRERCRTNVRLPMG
jgi:hypothetical protein